MFFSGGGALNGIFSASLAACKIRSANNWEGRLNYGCDVIATKLSLNKLVLTGVNIFTDFSKLHKTASINIAGQLICETTDVSAIQLVCDWRVCNTTHMRLV